jgi:4-hydroxysphinganine ceramide fatty acyl 2-hydroxylase
MKRDFACVECGDYAHQYAIHAAPATLTDQPFWRSMVFYGIASKAPRQKGSHPADPVTSQRHFKRPRLVVKLWAAHEPSASPAMPPSTSQAVPAGELRKRVRPAAAAVAAAAATVDEHRPSGYALTRKVVAHHNAPNNAWVAYKGGVYDVTTFLDAHPGGSDALEPYLGQDVTEVMAGGGNGASSVLHEHSAFAFKMLEKYRIGTLLDADPAVHVADGNEDPATGKTLVDWTLPILPQVGALGPRYTRWIHSFPTTDHTVQMFTNDTIENLTKCPWYIPLVVWIPVMCVELAHYVSLVGGLSNVDPVKFAVFATLGAVFWLWFEYSLHRWVFHWETSSYWANIAHFLIHGHHHITPMDFDRLVFPPVPALLVGWPFWVFAPKVMGTAAGYPWLLGFVAGYLVYDMTHFWIHHGVPTGSFLKAQKCRHVHHHYFKPSVNFGISNPLFDVVLGTLVEPQ